MPRKIGREQEAAICGSWLRPSVPSLSPPPAATKAPSLPPALANLAKPCSLPATKAPTLPSLSPPPAATILESPCPLVGPIVGQENVPDCLHICIVYIPGVPKGSFEDNFERLHFWITLDSFGQFGPSRAILNHFGSRCPKNMD